MKFETLISLTISLLLIIGTTKATNTQTFFATGDVPNFTDTLSGKTALFIPCDTGSYSPIAINSLYLVDTCIVNFYIYDDTAVTYKITFLDGTDVPDSTELCLRKDSIIKHWVYKDGIIKCLSSWGVQLYSHKTIKYGKNMDLSPFFYCKIKGVANKEVNFAGAKVFRDKPWPHVINKNIITEEETIGLVPEHRKYIKYCGNNDYILSLTVDGNNDTLLKLPKFDIVLVVDLSSSMDYLMYSDTISRLEVLKENLIKENGFIENIFNSIADVNIAICGFSGYSHHNDVKSGVEVPYNDAMIIIDWISNKNTNNKEKIIETIKSVDTKMISGRVYGNATNIQAGLMMAGEIITDSVSATRPDAKKIVILLSDGKPTIFYGNGEDYVFDRKTGMKDNSDNMIMGAEGISYGSGSIDMMSTTHASVDSWLEWATDYDSAGNKIWIRSDCEGSALMPSRRAWQVADTLGTRITDFYTIGCDTEDNYFLKGAREHTRLVNTAGFSAKESEQLNKIFDSIMIKTDIKRIHKVVIEDVLSEYVKIPENRLSWYLTIDGVKQNNTENIIESAVYIPDNHKVRLEFAKTYALDCKKTYAFNFKVVPSEKAFTEYENNILSGDSVGYGNTAGSENSDAPNNYTSSGKPGFYSNNTENDNEHITLWYNFGDNNSEQHVVKYAEKPVIQVHYIEPTTNIIKKGDCALTYNSNFSGKCLETECTSFIDSDDEEEYDVVFLDGRCWMRENLRKKTTGSKLYRSTFYPNSVSVDIYGYLYTWEEAANLATTETETPITANEFVRGICPEGWHLPTVDDINSLRTFLAEELKSNDYWIYPENGTNSSDFNAVPAGKFNGESQRFEDLFGQAFFHSDHANNAFGLHYYCCKVLDGLETKNNAYSIRCVKDCY